MKRNNIQNRFGWMPASLLLLFATACSESIIDTANVNGNVPNVVTFTVNTESNTISTRTGDGEDDAAASTTYNISDGSHADVLKYAVYSIEGTNSDGTEILKLEEEFGKTNTVGNVTAGNGQVVLSPNQYPHKIKLSLTPGKEYRVAFWAQSRETEAYDTQDLTKVKVKYDNAKNNDELRDAFCAISNKIDYMKESETVTLRRPLAQVNVGTTGWDYEGAAELKPGSMIYTQSQVTLKGVAQYYNVLEGMAIVDTDTHPTTDVTFDYARIPAFINVAEDSEEWTDSKYKYKPFDNEEYLKVKLYDEEGFAKYYGWQDYQNYINAKKDDGTLENTGLPKTEKFKYLSMSYVLVPEAKQFSADEVPNATNGAVLGSVEFNMKGNNINADGSLDNKEIFLKSNAFTINNVPVQKNWRTNILGNNFFVLDQPLMLTIVTDYYGDYNYNAADKEDTGNKQEDEAHDVWFDNYGCGDTKQNAQESSDYFKMLNHNYNLPEGPSFHKHGADYTSIYNGKAVGKVLKMQGKTGIAFNVTDPSTVTIVQAIARNSNSMPAADGTLLFYKKLEGETLNASKTYTGITELTTTTELLNQNHTDVDNYFNQNEYNVEPFIRLNVDGATETSDYSATTEVYTTDFYEGQTNSNTETNENVRIYKIYIESPGTYILRNGGKYKPGVPLKNIYKKSDGTLVDKADESGIAFIKMQKGDHRQETVEEEPDEWKQEENEGYEGKDKENKTESSDPADE